MKCSIISLLSMIIAVAFGAESPYPKKIKPHYPIITGGRTHKLEPTCPWMSTYKVDCVDFGPVPRYEGLSVNEKNLVKKMKSELVKREFFDGYVCNIQVDKIIVNRKDYGSHYIRTMMG